MKTKFCEKYEFDLDDVVHMAISGTTGSGKSVAVNKLIYELVSNNSPEDLGLVLIDPKQVEFTLWSKVPHLVVPVITDTSHAQAILNWSVTQMEERYAIMKERGIKQWDGGKLVIVVDELSDLMMTDRKNVEAQLVRLAQKARASGIHLVLSTQSPRAEVLTGLLRANIPTKMTLKVKDGLESRIAIGRNGGEKLQGRGHAILIDMNDEEHRFKVDYISDETIKALVEDIA